MLLKFYSALVTINYLNKETMQTIHMIIYLFVLNIFIYLTDFLDGKLARKWNACSKAGEVLDVLADLGYMTSQYCLIIKVGYMPWIILVCIYLEFLVFMLTSIYYKPTTKRIFFFNQIGKSVAAYYYLLPLLYIVTIYLQCNVQIFTGISVTCVGLTAIAIADRLVVCLRLRKSKKEIMYISPEKG